MPIETPEYIIGCGGNSSGIVERLMEKEWLLEEAVTEDRKLKAVTVDSATGNTEKNERAEAEDRIQGLIDKYRRKTNQNYTQVEFEHYNYVLNTEDGRTAKRFLTNGQDIRDLFQKSEYLENCWWIDDDKHGDLLSGGFDNGVERRRALSKALYHVSSVYDDNSGKTHPQNLSVSSGDEVVMVVSLGGGTGSGTFLDIAQDINSGATIHLFAVIPDAGHGSGRADGSDELASAYAALSELEYLEVAGQSPFENIVVLPHLQQSNISDEDFENGAISSILSYLNAMNDDNASNHITPGMNNAIDNYYSFVLSIPRIVEYDAGRREEAQEDVDEYLQTRDEQLRVERGTYETVEHYLQHNFPKSFGETLELIRDGGGRTDAELSAGAEDEESHLMSMLVRLEDKVQGQFLRDDNLKVAGVDVDTFLSRFEEMYESQSELAGDPNSDLPPYERIENTDTDSPQYAEDTVHRLPAQMIQRFQPQRFDDQINEQIAALLIDEAQNIKQRAELLGAIYSTESSEVEGLGSEQVDDIKKALIDVVLDADTLNLVDEFPRDGIKAIRNSLWDSLGDTELQYARSLQFDEAIRDHLEENLDDWWNGEAANEIGIITEYGGRRSELADLLEQLNNACQQKADQFSKETVEAKRVGLRLREGDEEVNISQINQLLDDLDIDERIDQDVLIDQIRNLKQAKKAREEYSGGIFGGGEKHKVQFEGAKSSVNDEKYFEMTFSDIEDPFNVAYRYDFTTLLDDVDSRYNSAVDNVVSELEASLTDKDGQIKALRSSEFVEMDELLERLEENGTIPKPKRLIDEDNSEPLLVPAEETKVKEGLTELESVLRSLNEDDISSDFELGQHLGVDQIINYRTQLDEFAEADWEPETPIEEIIKPYLENIWAQQNELEEELSRLGSRYLDESNDGIYQSLERLLRLADTRSGLSTDEGLPLTHQGSNTQHGPDLTDTYEEFFEIPSTENREPRDDNVFRRTKQAKNRDLTDDPDDITESRVWDNRQDDIIEEFEESIRSIRDNDDDRNPVQLNKIGPDSDDTKTHLGELRLLNVFSSRDFERSGADQTSGGEQLAKVRDMSQSSLLSTLCHPQDGYLEKMASYGDPWSYTLVTFLSGFTLDMLEPVVANEGYAETYQTKLSEAEYPWRNHSLALEGNWDRLPDVAKQAEAKGDNWWPRGGAFLYRDRDDLFKPSDISEWTLKIRDDSLSRDEVQERFQDAYTIETFPSFVDLE